MVNPEMRREGSILLQQINYQPQKKFLIINLITIL